MRGKSHRCLGKYLVQHYMEEVPQRYQRAFLLGCIEPDRNPATYLKGSIRFQWLRGHNYRNARRVMRRISQRLEDKDQFSLFDYYTLGKLTHYLADAFTYPHNENYPDSLMDHRRYEDDLRIYLAEYLSRKKVQHQQARQDLADAIEALHQRYMESAADMRRDAEYILEATELLMAGCFPAAMAGQTV